MKNCLESQPAPQRDKPYFPQYRHLSVCLCADDFDFKKVKMWGRFLDISLSFGEYNHQSWIKGHQVVLKLSSQTSERGRIKTCVYLRLYVAIHRSTKQSALLYT